MAIPSWVHLSKTTGSGNDEISVTLDSHTGRSKREYTITGTTTTGSPAASDTLVISQAAATVYVSKTADTLSFIKTGATHTATVTSNAKTIKNTSTLPISVTINGGAATTIAAGDTLDLDTVGEDAAYTAVFSITMPENKTTNTVSRSYPLEFGSTSNKYTITCNQAAGTRSYSAITVSAFTYNDIPANGGSVTPTATATQTWGWNNSSTNGGTINFNVSGSTVTLTGDPVTSTTGTVAYSGTGVTTTTGSVSGSHLHTTDTDKTKKATASITITHEGKTGTNSADVYQRENKVTTYDNPVITSSGNTTIPASGATRTITATATQRRTWSSGDTDQNGSVTISYTGGSGTNNNQVTGAHLHTTQKAETTLGTITITASGEGSKTATKSEAVKQAANTPTYYDFHFSNGGNISTHTDVVKNTTVEFSSSAAGSFDIVNGKTGSANGIWQHVGWTSGDYNFVQLGASDVSATVKTAVTGFAVVSNNTEDKVTITANQTVNPRTGFVVTVNLSKNGKTGSFEITANQVAGEPVFEINPATLSFTATNGSTAQTFTITSNTNWTLS